MLALLGAMEAAGPGEFARGNSNGVALPAVTVKLKVPATVPEVREFAGTVATPEVVVSEIGFVANVPVGLVTVAAGAANVTAVAATRFPYASVTVTAMAVANLLPTAALCGEPLLTAMLTASPGEFVEENDTTVAGLDVTETV